MPKKKTNKNQNEKFAQDVLSEVNRLKQIAEQNVQANLAEMFSPSVKKMIAEAVMGENDDFEEPSEEDLEDLEDALEEADYSDELEDDEDEDMEEGKYTFEMDDEDDYEDLEDLEEGEKSDDDDYEEEMDDDYEEEMDDDFEELDEEFIRELESILEGGDEDDEEYDFDDLDEMDKEEIDEDASGHSYSEKDPKPAIDADPHHDKKGGSLSEKGKGEYEDEMDEDASGHSYSEKDPKPKMDADPHTDSYIKENRQLKRMMRKVMRTLNEVTLDNDKTQELKNIFENYNVPEKAKVRVLSAIDKAKTKSEMFAISEAVKKQYKRKDSKRRVNESVRGSKKIGGNSKIKKIKKGTKGKNLKESINYDFANRLAEIANIG